jgi:hypothetical protein
MFLHLCLFQRFQKNKLLYPKRCLAVYLKRTEQFRNIGTESDVTELFISVNKSHRPVTAQTISSWIVKVIKYAYKNSKKNIKNVKGHSTRSVCPSWALFHGATVKSVMESADRSKETIFVKHYFTTVNVDFLKTTRDK